jgi:hypothetical protein
MKGLLFRFLMFVGMLYALERLSLAIVIVGVGLGLACMAVFHILANPDSADPA